jgi:hypothetical protein
MVSAAVEAELAALVVLAELAELAALIVLAADREACRQHRSLPKGIRVHCVP